MSEVVARQSPIPIKNLYYMLCYAWNILSITDDVKVGADDCDNAYNLLARVFSFGIGKLIRSGFHRSYVEFTEELTTVRGSINITESINNNSLLNKKIACTFDEYSPNDHFNQILKYTITQLVKSKEINDGTKKDLKKQLLFFKDIDSIPPTKENRQKLVFNRNNVIYRLLITIAIMLYDNTFVNEEDGKLIFKDFFRQQQMERVFELFILNFYKKHLNKSTYRVHAPKIRWHIDSEAEDMYAGLFDIENDPGDRRTDIVVENKRLNLQLIFDAKYYERTFVTAYMNENEQSVRTGHLNQLRGYILDSTFPGKRFGALLYPQTTHDIHQGRMIPIQNSYIVIKTINLNADWHEIEEDLLSFVHKFEQPLLNNA